MLIYHHINHDSYGKGLRSAALKLFLKTVSDKFKTIIYRPYPNTYIPRTINERFILRAQLLKNKYHPLRKFNYDRYAIRFCYKTLSYMSNYSQEVYNNIHKTISFKLGSYYQWTYKKRVKKPDRT